MDVRERYERPISILDEDISVGELSKNVSVYSMSLLAALNRRPYLAPFDVTEGDPSIWLGLLDHGGAAFCRAAWPCTVLIQP